MLLQRLSDVDRCWIGQTQWDWVCFSLAVMVSSLLFLSRANDHGYKTLWLDSKHAYRDWGFIKHHLERDLVAFVFRLEYL